MVGRLVFLQLCLVALLLWSCAPHDDMTRRYDFDSEFSTEEQVIIQQSLAKWSEVSVYHMYRGAGGVTIRKLESDTAGKWYGGGRLIVVAPWVSQDPELFRAVVMHEIGHSIGLGHTTSGVMFPSTDGSRITEVDLAECRRVGACGEGAGP